MYWSDDNRRSLIAKIVSNLLNKGLVGGYVKGELQRVELLAKSLDEFLDHNRVQFDDIIPPPEEDCAFE